MRPYRWQDPPPPPVREIRWRREQLMRFNAEPETIALPVRDMSEPKGPSMTIEGVEYVEAPATCACDGCAFSRDAKACSVRYWPARDTFGGGCDSRRVIYIRKA